MTSPLFPLIYLPLFVLTFLIIWEFAGYPLLTTVIALRRKPPIKEYGYEPFFSIIVPTYNEATSIQARICNLYDLEYAAQNYEIIIVDSGSTDDTASVVRELLQHDSVSLLPQVRLVEESARHGKGAAINTGKVHAKGDIIIVTDANAFFDRNVLKEIAPHFKDPCVGAVGGRYKVRNADNGLTRATKYYRDLEHLLRTGEAALFSACLFDGEINAWRKESVEVDPAMIAEDLDMCIKLRKQGYTIAYEPNAIVCEAVPTTVRDQVLQRRRTSIGTITSILNNLSYVAVPKDPYRLLILPSHKSLAMLSPFVMLALLATYFVAFDWRLALFGLAASIIVFAVTFALFTWGRSRLGSDYQTVRLTPVAVARMIWYVLLNEFIILLAWKDVVLGNYSVLWDKVTTTRSEGKS